GRSRARPGPSHRVPPTGALPPGPSHRTPSDVPPVHPLLLDYDADRLAAAARDADLRLVLLFGSRATGQADEESDLDVAVLAGHRRADVGAPYEALGPAFPGHELDGGLLNDADPPFPYAVIPAARQRQSGGEGTSA